MFCNVRKLKSALPPTTQLRHRSRRVFAVVHVAQPVDVATGCGNAAVLIQEQNPGHIRRIEHRKHGTVAIDQNGHSRFSQARAVRLTTFCCADSNYFWTGNCP